ncbi:peptidyl-prolyl cis-trans isomerase FKBP8-like [Elgaria multicarinata webbii]|uniref:peptidyl-prolyl cis-trans isomerase FKBP8-like n=1 Tax=Elgaria multicarinata webbii TaxID=159646 RepID=UPI002FCD4344
MESILGGKLEPSSWGVGRAYCNRHAEAVMELAATQSSWPTSLSPSPPPPALPWMQHAGGSSEPQEDLMISPPAKRSIFPGMEALEDGEEPSGRHGQEAEGSPRLRQRVQFLLPHTTIQVPPPQQEEQPFYQRLERLLGPAKQGSFEDLFAADGWEDLLEDKGLRKWLVRAGQGKGGRPRPGQEVTVKLLGVLEDQSLVEKDPKLTFVLGQGTAIQALELGVLSMQLGEVALLLANPACAYGHLGREPDIPKEAKLLYEVTLLQVQDSPDPSLLPAMERLSLGNQNREWGNFHFEREEYQQALHSYQQALCVLLLPSTDCLSPEEDEELRELQVKCLNNCAAAQLKLQLLDEALASCNEVMRLDPDNVKALYRKGKLLSERGEDQAAMAILKRALQLEPTTKAIHAELSKLARRQRGQPQGPARHLQEDAAAATVAHTSQLFTESRPRLTCDPGMGWRKCPPDFPSSRRQGRPFLASHGVLRNPPLRGKGLAGRRLSARRRARRLSWAGGSKRAHACLLACLPLPGRAARLARRAAAARVRTRSAAGVASRWGRDGAAPCLPAWPLRSPRNRPRAALAGRNLGLPSLSSPRLPFTRAGRERVNGTTASASREAEQAPPRCVTRVGRGGGARLRGRHVAAPPPQPIPELSV